MGVKPRSFPMTAITFDTLKLAQRLRDEALFEPRQAEKAASVLADTFADWQGSQELATKTDLGLFRSDLATGLTSLKGEFETKLAETKAEIIKWVVGIGFAQIAMILTVLKLHN